MNERSPLEDAFGLRWLQDDDQGRLIVGAGTAEFRSPGDAIRVLGLGCEEAALKESLDRFPPHLRIHGGYTPGLGEPITRFTLTWEPGAAEARFSQTQDRPEEGLSGNVDVPPDGTLKDVLKGLLIPDAQDVVSQAREDGKSVAMKDVDFWIGDQHFRVSDEDLS
jgi:hypothetical protein